MIDRLRTRWPGPRRGVRLWLGGFWPTACVLAQAEWVNPHKATVQKMADALVAAVHWIHTHSAAQVAARWPAGFAGARRQGKRRWRPGNR